MKTKRNSVKLNFRRRRINYYNSTFMILLFFIISICRPCTGYSEEEYVIKYSTEEALPPVIGESFKLLYSGNKSFSEISQLYSIGYLELREANPEVDELLSFSGKEILIPGSRILPEVMKEGIIINLAELRLYYFKTVNETTINVRSFPIGIGRSGYETPTGNFRITRKVENPTWVPPPSSRKRYPNLPKTVPPGDKNPLGRYWLQLSLKGYGLHGTNKPKSIGKRVSLGCIRLFNENIKWLFGQAYKEMPVKIVNMPVKFGCLNDILYIEVHKNGLPIKSIMKKAQELSRKKNILSMNTEFLENMIKEGLGIPLAVPERKCSLPDLMEKEKSGSDEIYR